MKNKKKISKAIILLLVSLGLAACSAEEEKQDKAAYQMISMEDASEIFKEEGEYIIVDVRTQEEYAEGHIPGAVCIPNESIGTEEIAELPDKDQVVYVYCRSGNRSKQAADKLADMGYTNIVEFGGIIDWKGEVEK